jgi:hypothetical protein
LLPRASFSSISSILCVGVFISYSLRLLMPDPLNSPTTSECSPFATGSCVMRVSGKPGPAAGLRIVNLLIV